MVAAGFESRHEQTPDVFQSVVCSMELTWWGGLTGDGMTKMVTIYTLMCYGLRDSNTHACWFWRQVPFPGTSVYQRIYLIFDLSLRGLRSSQLLYIRTYIGGVGRTGKVVEVLDWSNEGGSGYEVSVHSLFLWWEVILNCTFSWTTSFQFLRLTLALM